MNTIGYVDARRVTVLMPVYNAARYLREAIDSILSQSVQDFEFLIIDDRSQDDSRTIIESYDDSRIRLVCNSQHLGIVETLNRGLALASEEFVARMDADDVSVPDRLEKQCRFLDSNPEVGLVGGAVDLIDRAGKVRRHCRYPLSDGVIRWQLLFQTAFAHPAVMIRKSVLDAASLRYRQEASHAEDSDLWLRLAEHTRLANLAETVLRYRIHEGAVTARHWVEQSRVVISRETSWTYPADKPGTIEELRILKKVHRGMMAPDPAQMKRVRGWLALAQDSYLTNLRLSLAERRAIQRITRRVWSIAVGITMHHHGIRALSLCRGERDLRLSLPLSFAAFARSIWRGPVFEGERHEAS